jgi:MGT family glycosyltransferase
MGTYRRSVVAFCMPYCGHLQRMLPLLAGLARTGVPVYAFADPSGRVDVESTGASFVDLFSHVPKAELDPETRKPDAARWVTLAGLHADTFIKDVEALRPGLILQDAPAVIARVVARHFDLPRVVMQSSPTFDAQAWMRQYQAEPDIDASISARCRTAVHILRDRYGMEDASPFAAFLGPRGDLDVYSEPPEFMPHRTSGDGERVAYFGSLWPERLHRDLSSPSPFGPGRLASHRVYVSFGTTLWFRRKPDMIDALATIVDALAGMPETSAVVSLGGKPVEGPAVRLVRPNVRVESHVDQIRTLHDTTCCVTHHGMNTTHEAIYHGVPMISCPFMWDQPGTAARCQELGLAVPLASTDGTAFDVDDVTRAFEDVTRRETELRRRLADARQWELDVMARRPDVIRRVVSMMG